MAIKILLYACFDCERGKPLPVLVGNNRAHVGGVGCELVITYQETGLLRLRVPVRGGSPPRGRRSKQFDPFPPGWGPGGGASNFGPLPPWVGTRRRSKQFFSRFHTGVGTGMVAKIIHQNKPLPIQTARHQLKGHN